MRNRRNTFNSLGESMLSVRLRQIKYLLGLLLCIAGINFTINAAPGDLDTSFGTNGAVFIGPDGTINNRGYKAVLQPDGKIVMVGSKSPAGTGFIVARFNSNGGLDATFGTNGYISTTFGGNSEAAIGVAIQADGKIVVGGQVTFPNVNNQDIAVARFNSNGSKDTSFGTNGVAVIGFFDLSVGNYPDYFGAIKIASDGKIVVGGSVPNNPGSVNQHTTLARLNANGTFDTSFGTGGRVIDTGYGWNDLVVLPDGAVVAVGFISNTASDTMLARKYTAAGISEWEYTRGQSNTYAQLNGIAATADGKFVVVGSYGNSPSSFRLNANGTLDNTFAVDSVARQGRNTSVALQSDGKAVISTTLSDVSISSFGVIRLNTNGSPDTGFGSGGVVATAYPLVNILSLTVLVQSDGKIIIAGNAARSMPSGNQFALVRYVGDPVVTVAPRAAFDYDGDGKADVSVFRPSENRWYILKSSNSTFQQSDFGTSGDVPVPADYDGDRKTDVAIFRPSTGAWWYIASGNGAYRAVAWGAAGDVPRPSDFDGDGKTDYVVFRPSNGVWYRLNDAGQTSQIAFGLSDDKPVIGDFDGDGKSDPAIYRPSTGVWWYAASGSSNAQRAVQFGISTDIPAPADYDGDGKTDLAVYRAAEGVWHILRSGSGYTSQQFGDASDKPVAADYDGDGKADIGVFRPSNGSWYLQRSTAGFSGVQWGASNDIPTENSFI